MSRRRLSCSVSMMFREAPLLERFAAAKAAGFEGVEIQVLMEGAPDDMARAARAADLEVVLINVDLGDYLMGGPGLSGVPGREDAFSAALDRALAAAELLDPAFIHVGPSRIAEGETRDACLDVYRRNLALAVERRARAGVRGRLVVEPMNRIEAPTALLTDIDDVARVLAESDGDIGILFDLYHLAMNERDIPAAYESNAARVAHVQFSDAPGRVQPGAGKLDIHGLLTALEERGYSGWFGAEYMPRSPTLETLGWMEKLARG